MRKCFCLLAVGSDGEPSAGKLSELIHSHTAQTPLPVQVKQGQFNKYSFPLSIITGKSGTPAELCAGGGKAVFSLGLDVRVRVCVRASIRPLFFLHSCAFIIQIYINTMA